LTDLFPGFDGSVDFYCKFFRSFSFMVKIGFSGLASFSILFMLIGVGCLYETSVGNTFGLV